MTDTSCPGPGRARPMIDATSCEGKSDCVTVCPFDVFEVRKLTAAEWSDLPLMARLKVFVHGGKQGFVARPDACEACGLCVRACPENAIRLEPRAAAA